MKLDHVIQSMISEIKRYEGSDIVVKYDEEKKCFSYQNNYGESRSVPQDDFVTFLCGELTRARRENWYDDVPERRREISKLGVGLYYHQEPPVQSNLIIHALGQKTIVPIALDDIDTEPKKDRVAKQLVMFLSNWYLSIANKEYRADAIVHLKDTRLSFSYLNRPIGELFEHIRSFADQIVLYQSLVNHRDKGDVSE